LCEEVDSMLFSDPCPTANDVLPGKGRIHLSDFEEATKILPDATSIPDPTANDAHQPS
jgi:hypothetical protein